MVTVELSRPGHFSDGWRIEIVAHLPEIVVPEEPSDPVRFRGVVAGILLPPRPLQKAYYDRTDRLTYDELVIYELRRVT